MPLYSYECSNKKCGKYDKIMDFIVPLEIHDTVIKCPLCARPLHKRLSAPYFSIK
jgi:predicted nucleic acid-binding Zn ribbon protein